MDKIGFMRLWDVYSGLLTPTQREMTDLYFNLDLTLSEIAEQKGISRQAVSDCLAGCKRQLEEYEEKLHVLRLSDEYSLEVSFMMTDAARWAEKFSAAHPGCEAEIKELTDILERDYSAEAKAAEEKSRGEAWRYSRRYPKD